MSQVRLLKFVLASYGTRGDVEPCAAIGRELMRRGHEVQMAVPPQVIGFVESVGLAAVACGPDSVLRDDERDRFSRIQNPVSALCEFVEYATQLWVEMSTVLTALAGAQMTKPADSAARAADLLENAARRGRFD